MKIILLQDIRDIGKKYDVKDVANGHALNFLIPRKLAQIATPALVKQVTAMKAKEAEAKRAAEATVVKALESLKSRSIEIEEKANEKGHLFSAVHKAEIVKVLNQAAGVTLADSQVDLDKPVKEVGEFPFEITVGDKAIKFKLVVKAQG
jgi:large subunit ribosomal protein L9